MSPPPSCDGSLFEQPGYVRAAAAAHGAKVRIVESAGAMLPLLDCPDGVLRTVPGFPRPYGANLPWGLDELARELTEPDVRLVATLSPLRCGPELARQMSVRGARLAGERQICVAELDPAGPRGAAGGELANRLLDAATEQELRTELTSANGWFASFQQTAVAFTGTSSVGDDHLAAIAKLDHYVVAVHDRDGLAVAALFLCDGNEAYLHLGGRRADPAPPAAVVAVALAAGIVEARRSGCRLAVLGGGRSELPGDPVLQVKQALAGAVLPSFTVDVGLVFD
jgi:hypothetical protein